MAEFLPQIIFFIVLILIAYGSVYTVKQKTAVIIERLGKFQTVSTAGLKFKIPFIKCNPFLIYR